MRRLARLFGARRDRAAPAPGRGGSDATHFLRNWLRGPLQIGAIAPSSRALGRAMAAHVPVDADAAVVELGPGTGVVTRCLVEHGVPERNLVLVEYSPEFCRLLKARFPQARIVEGDAYAPGSALAEALAGRRVGATVSSLPLMTRPPAEREAAVGQHLAGMDRGRPFVQFTYSPRPPVEAERIGARLVAGAWVALNLPPARVLVYAR